MSIGSQLRQARQSQTLSLDQVSQATHIKLHYLEALEADQFQLLPSAAQLRGFLRTYAEYLKLNSAELLGMLTKDASVNAVEITPPSPSTQGIQAGVNSAAIFKELGSLLRSQRELMSLTLGDVERHTHIRMHYIRALEEGDIAHLPSPVQGRGMLSNYASFLGLDTETVLLRFADGLQASLYDRQAARNVAPGGPGKPKAGQVPARPSQLKRLFSMDLFVGGFLILFLLGFTIWGGLRISRLHASQDPSPTAPPVSEILLTSPTQATSTFLTPIPSSQATLLTTVVIPPSLITGTVQADLTPTALGFETTPGLEYAPIQVYIIAIQRAWMRVTVDGEVAFEGRVVQGSAYSFAARQQIDLLTGDAAGLQVYFNQQDLGTLGGFGEVVERVFSIEGVKTATPAVLPTSTPMPTGTITPTPTGVLKTPNPTP